MDKLVATGSVDSAHRDLPPVGGTPQYGTDGNPGTGTPATRWPAYWVNSLINELMAVLAAGGVTPDRNVETQLRDAIKAMTMPTKGSGWVLIKLADGTSKLLQWSNYNISIGSTSNVSSPATAGTGTVAFPLTFGLLENVQATPEVSTNTGQATVSVQYSGLGSVTLYVTDTSTTGFSKGRVFAVGNP